ncbi:MAG: SMP-30/gluconolactonase/LRE family protein [Bacteroidales bacterium]|nr:SMP-30/gluconolactonase/LRE family protein [Bacteroidales bacterium]MCB9012462.1 SMP-30/gluconolactonase/LRE family protein [Bacteroidales bacterium]
MGILRNFTKIQAIRFFISLLFILLAFNTFGQSFYDSKPNDPEAMYFTSSDFPIKADGKTDVSGALQQAINKIKSEKNFGILFIPEGKYLLSKTIYIPKAIRLIGYGKNRPEFILPDNCPGFQEEVQDDKGKANYMFWFTSGLVDSEDGRVDDANAGTFYSALSNINIRIGKGNPAAVALRTHFAQHSFISHCDIHIGSGKAGVYDVGNFMEDVRFFGGDYGIYTTKTSPGWQFMMIDTYFEGQRKAAIQTREAGLTIVRMQAKNVPHVIEVLPGYWEKLFMEDCRFSDVSKAAIVISDENNAHSQVNLLNIDCNNTPVLASFRISDSKLQGAGKIYKVKKYTYGLQMDELGDSPVFKATSDIVAMKEMPAAIPTDIPALPAMSEWVNLKELGAKGDGETDDTEILQKAVQDHRVIYVPQGWYLLSKPITLKPNTVLIGLNPVATQFILNDNTPAFSGFGSPVPLVEVPSAGNTIITGIGLSTGDYNSRAVACKWMGGEKSYMNDVKFIGGHGSMNRGMDEPWSRGPRVLTRENRVKQGMDPAWDTQYWSLWVEGGGGIFADIWTASTFAVNGAYISNTSVPGKIYAMSVEHHVRNEVRFKKVSNWKIYALQLEEESRESENCQPLEIQESENLLFANLYTFRVIRVNTPSPYAIRSWSNRNIEFLNYHNYTQTKYSFTNALYDVNSDIQVRPWEFARLIIGGSKVQKKDDGASGIKELAKGFEFAEGMCSDSKGNVYFSESRQKRIYKWSVDNQQLSLVADFQWEPQSLACDSKDNLLVVFRYNPQPGFMIDGKQEVYPNPPDAWGTSFSGWGNSGFAIWVYSIDPQNPETSIQKLPAVAMGSVENIYKAMYPSNRWRDSHDFYEVIVARAKDCFVAPDGKTIFPICYDFARSNSLVAAYPGKFMYASDEYDKRVVRLKVDEKGYLSDPVPFAEKGEYSTAVDSQGNVYVADGNIYVFNPGGQQVKFLEVPERPVSIAFGGRDMSDLFVTTAHSLYSVDIK